MKTSKRDCSFGTTLGPTGHALKEGIAALVRVGNLETLAGQEHFHFHTLVQLHQLIGSLRASHRFSVVN